MHLVCSLGYLEAARLLLDHGADTEQADEEELTPLHDACREGRVEVARLLLDCGADKDVADKKGVTTLHDTCGKGHLEVARLLIDGGADSDAADKDGDTPLHLGCYKGHLELVRLLLDRGADKEKTNNHGDTPLFDACCEGHLENIKLLLQRGATAIEEDEEDAYEEGREPEFPEESNALLRKWHALTPARGNAVLRLGWDYIDVPTRWTTQNHSQFPADFQQKVAAVALAWQLPLVPFNRKPGDLVQQVAEAAHARMGLR